MNEEKNMAYYYSNWMQMQWIFHCYFVRVRVDHPMVDDNDDDDYDESEFTFKFAPKNDVQIISKLIPLLEIPRCCLWTKKEKW